MAGVRVVIVDDEELIREVLRARLEVEPDIEVVAAAADGPTALALVAREQPDVVLLDMAMPGMDGAEVARRLRAECPHVAVVVLSGLDGAFLESILREAEVAGYVFKGMPGERLLAVVRRAAAAHRTP